MFRSGNRMPVPAHEFPEVFAVCRGISPFLQFQLLRLENGNYTSFQNLEVGRSTAYRFESRRTDDTYIVGTLEAQRARRVRFEIHPLYLIGVNAIIPVVFIDNFDVLPQPKSLIVPVNTSEATPDPNTEFSIQNYLLSERFHLQRQGQRIQVPDDDSELDSDEEMNRYRRGYIFGGVAPFEGNHRGAEATSRRRRVVGEVSHGSASAAGGGPRTPPRGSSPSSSASSTTISSAAGSRSSTLNEFTVRAIINQSIAEAVTCPIGMLPLEKDTAAVTTCQHVFDRSNITRWLETHDTCPVCRERTRIISTA